MTRLILITVSAIIIATQATALSCLRPDLARSFNSAADLPYDIAVFVGKITVDSKPFGGGGAEGLSEYSTFHKGSIVGYQIGPNGRTDNQTVPITVEKTCLGPWCGDLSQDVETVFFVSSAAGIGEDGWLATFGPCGENAFPADQANMATLQSCLQDGPCGN